MRAWRAGSDFMADSSSSGTWKQNRHPRRGRGVAGFTQWAYRWLYWNAGLRHLAKPLGVGMKKYGIQDPIIVYQMGKVGSTTVYISLKRLQLDVPLYHLHFLSDLDKMQGVVQAQVNHTIALQLNETARKIRREMEQSPQRKWNLIALTRTPVPRLISVFFQNLGNYFPEAAARYQAGALPLDEVTNYFIYRFREGWAENWFDRQMKEPFGLDVFAESFDRERGYQIYTHNSLRLLVLRLEDLNAVGPAAMHEFLNIPDFSVRNRNVGEGKPTGTLYRDFIATLRLPPARIQELHSSRYAQHFYTPQELEASIARWV